MRWSSRVGLVALLASVPAAGMAQSSLSAPQWIANCLAGEESPDGQQAYRLLGKKPPSHEENRAWCVGQWNSLHPKQKVSNGTG